MRTAQLALLVALASAAGCSGDSSPSGVGAAGSPVDVVVEITPSQLSLATGGNASLRAVVQDDRGNGIADAEVSWASEDEGIATVSDGGEVEAHSDGTVFMFAEYGQQRDTALVRVTAPDPDPSNDDESDSSDDSGGSGGGFTPSNRPAGFSTIAETSFEGSGNGFQHRAAEIVEDRSAPVSCCRVAEKRFAVGDAGGGGVALDRDISSAGATSVYAAVWVKFSSNFRNHSSGITKIFYAWSSGRPKMILTAYGPDLELRSLLRHAPDAGQYESPNRAPASKARLQRGRWQLVEYVVESASAPGRSDGAMRWWLDGELVGEYTGLATHESGESLEWSAVEWNTIWGGTGDRVTPSEGDMHVRASHLHISGR